MQTNEQVRTNSSMGSGELSGELSEELSAQHLDLKARVDCRVKIADIKLQIGRIVSHESTKATKEKKGDRLSF